MAIELLFGEALWGECRWGGFNWGGDDVFELPESLVLRGDSFRTRNEEKVRALSHGSAGYGDQVEARDLQIRGAIAHPEDPDAHLAYLLSLRQALRRPGLRLRYRPEFFCYAKCLDGGHDWSAEWGKTISDLELTFRLTDPFWYASSASTATSELTGNGTVVVNTATGSWPARVEVWPVITITAPPAGSVPSVVLRNESDEGMQFTYQDLQLKNGASVVLNFTGSPVVERGGANAIRCFDGAPLRLVAGENRLTYEGAACTLTIQYRARWI